MKLVKKFPTLYKTTNTGAIQEWDVEVYSVDSQGVIIVTYGQQDGKKQIKETYIQKGKNIGKKNETTPVEQALSEAESKLEKQLDKGYYKDITSAQNTRKVRPMLAKVYGDHKHKVKFPCYINPKLDGSRCLTYLDSLEMVSRLGNPIQTMIHIQEELKDLKKKYPDIILDGELYKHGEGFQTLISAIKRDEVSDKSGEIEYHVYDCFSLKKDLVYSDRLDILKDIGNKKFVKIVDAFKCNSEKEIFSYHEKFLSNGYEGSIIRNNASYQIDKRTSDLLKLKEWRDDEFQITGFSEDKNGHVVFELVTPEGEVFKAKPEGTDDERKQMLEDAPTLIGEMATVKYFEMSDKKVPRFPGIKSIRNYE